MTKEKKLQYKRVKFVFTSHSLSSMLNFGDNVSTGRITAWGRMELVYHPNRGMPMKTGLTAIMKLSLLAATLLSVIAACTTTSEIIIDEKGVNMSRYADDLAECKSYAEQVAVGEKAAKGAATGAVIGGAIGGVSGHRSVGEGAAVGVISGGAKGLDEGERGKVRVVKNCLRGRGYRVLN